MFALLDGQQGREQNPCSINILKKGLNILGIEWRNSTFGQKGTAPQGGTTGEICTSAVEGKPEIEPVTRIPRL